MLITIDFETYYDKTYSLTKLTTEEYINSPFFEVIGVGVKIDDEPSQWASGTYTEIKKWLMQFDWVHSAALAHNAMFDGAILNWIFDIRPKNWYDTLCLGRYLHGYEVSGSLKALAEHYGVGRKGVEVVAALGKHRADFTEEGLEAYGDYCLNDVELSYKLFLKMAEQVPLVERKVIDLTIRMFTEPTLRLDVTMLEQHLHETQKRKQFLVAQAGTVTEDLMSNQKFAILLAAQGVVPPTKVSPTTGQETLAMAKNDEEFMALMDHPNEQVQALMMARLGAKSTLEETRTETLISIAHRNDGALPVPLKYFAAHTGRWGGADSINLQNLPTRGANAGKIKRAIHAPEGYVLIDADSAQIEARVLAWLAGQEDLVRGFQAKEDVYRKMASEIYDGVPPDQVTDLQRQVGKVAILGAGYGMGATKFQVTLKSFGIDEDLDQCLKVIATYRKNNPDIVMFWKEANFNLSLIRDGLDGRFSTGRIRVVNGAFQLPDGRFLRYPGLKTADDGSFVYTRKKLTSKIYGGKVVENLCQAVARSIIAEQMAVIARRYRVVLTVHDSIVCVVDESFCEEAAQYVHDTMCWVPNWAQGLPVSCKVKVSKRYGEESI